MKKNTLLTLFTVLTSIILTLTSCSNDDTPIEEPIVCNVIGTNEFDNTLSINNSSEIVYLTQYTYDSENKLTSRIKYKDIYSIEADLKDVYNITYDSNNRISEIHTFNSFYNVYTSLKIFEYEDSNTLPHKLTRYRVEGNEDSQTLTYTENFTYNNQNQLSSTIRIYSENLVRNPVETTFKYNTEGNLIEKKAIASGEVEYDNWISIETFENYDDQKNPFKDLPFSDVRGISESNNNYFKYSKTINYNNESITDETIIPTPQESISYEFEPTDFYYTFLANYECNE